MSVNLDLLKTEVLEHLEREGFVIFHGYSRLGETDSFVAWDTDRYPEFRLFLSAAKKAGIKLIVYHHRDFSAGHIEDANDRLESANFTGEEQHAVERELRELSKYEGFTCALELSFDYQGRVYLFSLRSDWYEEYLDILEQIESSFSEEEDEDDSMGGYFSRN